MPREKEKEEEEEATRHVILFFGRLPTPGKCKTRLARDVRDETLAARLYKSCAERVLKRFRRETVDDCDINGDGAKSSSSRCSFRLVFYVAEKEEVEQVRAWLKESLCLPKVSVGDDELEEEEEAGPPVSSSTKIEVKAQDDRTSDLGLRMIRALNDEISSSSSPENGAGPDGESHTIFHVVGTDYPDASWKRLKESIKTMEGGRDHHSMKIGFGKAEDGGFWHMSTVGRLSESLFGREEEKSVRWSTNHTLEDAKNAAKKIGMIPCVEEACDPLCDIDTLEDIRKWIIATAKMEEKSRVDVEDEFTRLVKQVV
jgi:glycosyltransferase A (GT-A) superfamily protein (DUF2064 family)